MSKDKFSVCPRCESATIEVQFESPVKGAWVLYRCTTCLFTFRSSEPATMTDPKLYDPKFKFKPEDMPGFPVMPSIPPLNK